MIFCTKRSSSFSDFLTVGKFINTKCLKGDSHIQNTSEVAENFGGKKKVDTTSFQAYFSKGMPSSWVAWRFFWAEGTLCSWLHSHPENQEQTWLFGIATGKSARIKSVENMWHLRGMSSSLESENHGVQPQHAILRCLPGRAPGRKGLAAHGYLLTKQQNNDTSSLPQGCSCSLFLSHPCS